MCGYVKKSIRAIVLIFISAAILVFATHGWNSDLSQSWQMDSEDLVWGRILQMQQHEWGGGFLVKYVPTPEIGHVRECFRQGEVPEGEVTSYTHQSGLQGTFYGLVNLVLQIFFPQANIRWAALLFLNSVLYVSVMFFLGWWIWKKAGYAAALFGLSCILFMEYSLKAMPNLYWVVWTFILPFLVSAAVCEWLERKQGWGRLLLGAAVIGVATLLRSLCGFEFVSSVMVSAELPIVWKILDSQPEKKKMWFKFAVIAGLFQVVAFVAAMGIWIVQDFLYLQSWDLVKEDVLSTISKRTGAFAEWIPDQKKYHDSLAVPRLSVLEFYLEEKIYLGAFSVLDLIKCALISYLVIAAYTIWKKETKDRLIRQGCWFVFSLISVAGPASWYILASGHSSWHKPINGVLWLFPTIPLLLSVIGGNIAVLDAMLRKDKS